MCMHTHEQVLLYSRVELIQKAQVMKETIHSLEYFILLQTEKQKCGKYEANLRHMLYHVPLLTLPQSFGHWCVNDADPFLSSLIVQCKYIRKPVQSVYFSSEACF